MAGLVPAIHDLLGCTKDVDAGTRPGMTARISGRIAAIAAIAAEIRNIRIVRVGAVEQPGALVAAGGSAPDIVHAGVAREIAVGCAVVQGEPEEGGTAPKALRHDARTSS